ncbi:MAG TPA: cupin domain-containing protein [Candidatus Limnocylindrales bacterium]|jgi:hypothetical protein
MFGDVGQGGGLAMAGIETKSFDTPDETRTPPNTRVEVVRLGAHTAARFTFQPGWRWSESIKPVAKTDSCQARHVGAIVSGRLHVVHTDGSEGDAGPGDAYVIEPGHDAWVVGDEPVVAFEFESAETYAKG